MPPARYDTSMPPCVTLPDRAAFASILAATTPGELTRLLGKWSTWLARTYSARGMLTWHPTGDGCDDPRNHIL